MCYFSVIALDTSPTRLDLARHNAQIYGVADRIEFILTDYIAFANTYLSLPFTSPRNRKIDVVFLSPPWGGPSYLSPSLSPFESSPSPPPPQAPPGSHPQFSNAAAEYTLASIQPIHGAELFRLSRRITQNIAYYLPRNLALEEVAGLVDVSTNTTMPSTTPSTTEGKRNDGGPCLKAKPDGNMQEMVEVEEEWMGTKLKALTCYFGGLVNGQGEQF
jgi:trimethylguanosine synthase